MGEIKLINPFGEIDNDTYLETAEAVAKWIDRFSVKKEKGKSWKISSGEGSSEGDELAGKLSDRTIYSGAAGIGYFYIQLYEITGKNEYLKEAVEAGEYLLDTYDEEFGKKPGIHTGLSGEGVFAKKREITNIWNMQKRSEMPFINTLLRKTEKFTGII